MTRWRRPGANEILLAYLLLAAVGFVLNWLSRSVSSPSPLLAFSITALLVWRVSRGGSEYAIGFADGELASNLKEVGNVPKSRTGTTLRFWPDAKYFDSPMISIPRLKQVLRAKAALCPNLRVSMEDQINGEQVVWCPPDSS